MKRPRVLRDLMVARRQRALWLLDKRRLFKEYKIKVKSRRVLLGPLHEIPRISVRSLLRLAAQNRRYAGSSWQCHDTEYYSACGWDDYQIERRQNARRAAEAYSKAARYLYSKGYEL
jgi:hypothetical protein